MTTTVLSRDCGSPPRARGKPIASLNQQKRTGITPAGAGKTKPLQGHPAGFPDHPRGRGENLWRSGSKTTFTGSPPRVRGKLQRIPDKYVLYQLLAPFFIQFSKCRKALQIITKKVKGPNKHSFLYNKTRMRKA